MKTLLYVGCYAVMIALSVALWRIHGLRIWAVVAALMVLSCPVLAIVAAFREERRTRRAVDDLIQKTRRESTSQ